jgi:hypothetical protein
MVILKFVNSILWCWIEIVLNVLGIQFQCLGNIVKKCGKLERKKKQNLEKNRKDFFEFQINWNEANILFN